MLALGVVLTGCAEIGSRDLPPERVYIPSEPKSANSAGDGSIFSLAGQGGCSGKTAPVSRATSSRC